MSFQSIYEIVPLGDVASFINGDRSTNYPKGDDYVDDGVPFISAADLVEGRIDIASVRRISQNAYDRLRSGKIRKDDVLFCLRGSIGKIARIRENEHGAIASSLVIVRATEKVKPQYLYFYLSSQAGQQAALGLNNGAAQPNLSVSELQKISFPLPPLPVQRRIAGILSAYDDLIENNQRRIAILERMARALYREWFVHFRYPGHEGVPLVDSPLGQIPQGWEVRKLIDVCRLTMGQSPKSEYYNEVGDGVAFHQGVTDFGDRFPSDRLFCTVDGRSAETGDILFSVRAPVGRMNIANKRIILGRGLSAIRHNDDHQAFLWEQLRNRFTEDDMIGNGSIFASVTKDEMQSISLLCPPKELIEAITSHFDPLHLEVSTLSQKTQNLRRTRDLLLPRLLSGQLDVGELDDA